MKKSKQKNNMVDCSEFLLWLMDKVLDEEDWDLNSGAYGELICRRLEKLGLLEVKDGYYTTFYYTDWTPVSEQLPDEEDYNEYLVTDKNGHMAVGSYRHDAQAWDSGDFGWLEIRDRTDEFPWGIDKVVAYHKLPKQYSEE